MVIILFGPPGVGKGTQADLICKAHGLEHISTGALLRKEIASESSLGQEVAEIMNKGQFPNDSLIMDIVSDRFHELQKDPHLKGFVLDGIPRTLPQAELLDKVLVKNGFSIDALIVLEAPDAFLIGRIEKRQVCDKCGKSYHLEELPPKEPGVCDSCHVALSTRPDDTRNTIKTRIDLYREQTAPVLAYYEKKSFVHKINAIGTVQDIFSSINVLLCREKLDSCNESL